MTRIVALAICALCAVSCADHRAAVAAALHQRLEADARKATLTRNLCARTGDPACAKRANEIWKDLTAFYDARGGEPVWVNGSRPGSAATIAIAALSRASEHGLDPERYGASSLKAEVANVKSADQLAEFESKLTAALLALGRDVAVGVAGPAPSGVGDRRRSPPDIAANLGSVVDEGDVTLWPDDVRPKHPQYAALQAALARDPASTDRPVIALNLERWRWMPDVADDYVLVNVPSFHMWVYESGRPALDSKVIVGRLGDETPIFSADMTTVVFSPYWNIPESIAEGETVPSIVKNPAYLAKSRIDVLRRTSNGVERVDPESVDWNDPAETSTISLRQRPGPGNALGNVKFLLPNKNNVYLHDTPTLKLFERNGRAFSHGCIRVHEPMELAQYLLRDDPKWTPDAIKKAMHSGDEQGVQLKSPLPVHIVYFTAWAEPDGTVKRLLDVYSLDRRR